MAQHSAVLHILKVNAPLEGKSAKTGRDYSIQDAECVLYDADGEVAQVGVLMLPKALRESAKPGFYTGSFSMMADRQTRRINSVLVGLTPMPPGFAPGPSSAPKPAVK